MLNKYLTHVPTAFAKGCELAITDISVYLIAKKLNFKFIHKIYKTFTSVLSRSTKMALLFQHFDT